MLTRELDLRYYKMSEDSNYLSSLMKLRKGEETASPLLSLLNAEDLLTKTCHQIESASYQVWSICHHQLKFRCVSMKIYSIIIHIKILIGTSEASECRTSEASDASPDKFIYIVNYVITRNKFKVTHRNVYPA